MVRYKLELEYIGSGYAGSQLQGGRKRDEEEKSAIIEGQRIESISTIQGELEKALRTLTKQNIKTIFSGRTDAGVNAKGQVAHFNYDKTFVASKFINSLNGLLPNDISVKSIEQVPDSFHAQKSARWRWYRYSITNRTQRSAFDRHTLLVRNALSLENINASLKILEGEHNFSAFRSSGSKTPSDVCKIFLANAHRNGDEIIIDIVGSRFLYNMIRTIVGTILMLEKDGKDPREIEKILLSKDRKIAGPTISPEGLTFMKVSYEPWTQDTKNKIINGDKRI